MGKVTEVHQGTDSIIFQDEDENVCGEYFKSRPTEPVGERSKSSKVGGNKPKQKTRTLEEVAGIETDD